MKEIEQFKEKILKEYPRLTKEDSFRFSCHPGVSCFNKCCADVNIFLTPFDIIRLKNRLKMDSGEFLEKYTFLPIDKNQRYPVVMLQMNDSDEKECPFVDPEKGCTVYEDRPWACRMYPLGIASPKETGLPKDEKDFYFLLEDEKDFCQGFKEDRQYTVAEWLDDQGIDEYNEGGELFKKITLHSYFEKGHILEPKKMEMFYMVCYNIDRFREFVFKTTFLKRFEVPADMIERIKTDDYELFKLGVYWLRFALFGEKTLHVKSRTGK